MWLRLASDCAAKVGSQLLLLLPCLWSSGITGDHRHAWFLPLLANGKTETLKVTEAETPYTTARAL